MRLVVGLILLLVVAALGGFAMWPGLIPAAEQIALLVSFEAFGVDTALHLTASFMSYAAMAAVTFIVVFVTVRKLTDDR
jgi:hypothetical protein